MYSDSPSLSLHGGLVLDLLRGGGDLTGVLGGCAGVIGVLEGCPSDGGGHSGICSGTGLTVKPQKEIPLSHSARAARLTK